MLLRNESRVKHIIEVKLVFDDNTTREIEIYEGQCVHVTYKKNGCINCEVGVIREIKPYIKKLCCKLVETAVIVLDASENNYARVEKIELDDIVDISHLCNECPGIPEPDPEPVYKCCCKNCTCYPEDDETTDEEITDDEVIEDTENEETDKEEVKDEVIETPEEEVVIHE